MRMVAGVRTGRRQWHAIVSSLVFCCRHFERRGMSEGDLERGHVAIATRRPGYSELVDDIARSRSDW